MFSVCPNYSSDRLITSPLVAKKMQAYQKIWSAVVTVFALQVVTISTVHHFFPKSSFFYGYTATALCVGFLAIVAFAVSQYIEWKQLQNEEKEKTRTLFGLTFEAQTKSKAVVAEIKSQPEAVQPSVLCTFLDEVLLRIFGFLSLKELSQLEKTCKRFHNLLKDEIFWKNLLLSHFEQVKLPKQDFKKEYRLFYSFKHNIFNTHTLNVDKGVKSFHAGNDSLLFVGKRSIEDSKGKLLKVTQTKYFPNFHFTDNFIFVTNPGYRVNTVYVPNQNWMEVYDKNFDLKFKYIFPDISFNAKRPFLENGKQIFVAMESSLYCFDQNTGELQKNIILTEAIYSIFLFQNLIYVCETGKVDAYRQSDLGLEKSNLHSSWHKFWCTASCSSKKYLVSSTTNKLSLFPNTDEKLIDLGNLSARVEQVFAHGKFLFAGDQSGHLQVWDMETLSFINQFSLFEGSFSHPLVEGCNFLYAAHSSYSTCSIKRINLTNLEIASFDSWKTYEKDGAILQMELVDDKLVLLQPGSHKEPSQKLKIYDFGKFY